MKDESCNGKLAHAIWANGGAMLDLIGNERLGRIRYVGEPLAQRLLTVDAVTVCGPIGGMAMAAPQRHRGQDSNMSREIYTDRRKESTPPEFGELRGYLNQLPLPWRDKMLPLCDRVGAYIGMQYKLLRIAQDTVENLQMDVRYLMFDVEATARERDQLLRELGIGGEEEAEGE
jgi:hypothetical protein